jgi:hypothetical protein
VRLVLTGTPDAVLSHQIILCRSYHVQTPTFEDHSRLP